MTQTPDLQAIVERCTNWALLNGLGYVNYGDLLRFAEYCALEATTQLATKSKVVIDKLKEELAVVSLANQSANDLIGAQAEANDKLISALQAKIVKKDETLDGCQRTLDVLSTFNRHSPVWIQIGASEVIEKAQKAISPQQPTQLLVNRQELEEMKRDKERMDFLENYTVLVGYSLEAYHEDNEVTRESIDDLMTAIDQSKGAK